MVDKNHYICICIHHVMDPAHSPELLYSIKQVIETKDIPCLQVKKEVTRMKDIYFYVNK